MFKAEFVAKAGAFVVKERAQEGYPVTPDGRYFVVKGRLWRCSNPSLSSDVRQELVRALMQARRAKGNAMRTGDKTALEAARQNVDAAKQGLGERGPVWWVDGTADLNRYMVANTPYAEWFAEQAEQKARKTRLLSDVTLR